MRIKMNDMFENRIELSAEKDLRELMVKELKDTKGRLTRELSSNPAVQK